MMHLTTFVKAKIIVLYEDNISIREIARRLQISRTSVHLWIRRYQHTGDVERNRPGPKAVMFTPSSSRHRDIMTIHRENPFASTRSTAAQFGVSMPTVRNHLHAGELNCRKPAKKILLSAAHRQERLRFAQHYLNFDWINNIVIFTDEKCFKSDKDGRKILWRGKGDRYNPINIMPCRSSGRITLGYWGWMSSMGPGELVQVGGRNTGHGYLEILRDVMLPSVNVCYPHEHIYLIHDNCSIHRAHIVQNWLQTQTNVTVIDWPSKSPDLNPIENLWGQMVLNWDPSEVRNQSNLDDVVTSTWESLRGTDMCFNMIAGMRSRLEQVIESEGAPIPY